VQKHLTRVVAGFEALGPCATVFLGSLLLSLVAVQGGTINRDGMFYVESARNFVEGGFAAAYATFHWPFLSILMAVVSQVTGLDLEASGQVINALFLAGACALLVACAGRLFPEAVWPMATVLLALPGFNDYRDELLREYGCWFFVMLSFWLALRWADRPRWLPAMAVQLSLIVAALFRTEALAFFPTLILWQLFEAPAGERWRRLAMIGGLPLAGLGVLFALYFSGQLGTGRLASDFGRFSVERFNAKALAMASAFIGYARDQARTVLFFGSLAIVPLKFVGKMGIFVLPLLYAFRGQSLRAMLGRCRLFAWAFLAHALVLCAFVLDLQFLAGRYVGLLLAFSAPLTGYGLWLLMQRFPAWKIPMMLLVLVVMVTNVVSLAPTKKHFVEAGGWLATNASDSPRVYVESPRAAYYAGWRFTARSLPEDRSALALGVKQGKYDLVVLEVSREEANAGRLLQELKLAEVARFAHPNGDAVIVARPELAAVPAQDKVSNTPAMRAKPAARE
jgi:hypothetical protein